VSENKESDKIEKIRRLILKSGYPTEIEVGNILRKSGWLVGNQWPYKDKATGKIRTIDVLAMRMRLQAPKLGLLLLVECKKGENHDWVFYTQQKETEFLPLMGTIFDVVKKVTTPALSKQFEQLITKATVGGMFGLETRSSALLSKLSGLHVLNKTIRIGVFNVVPSSRDDFFEATQQIISTLESMSEGMKTFIVSPLIVFDGGIYEFYQENSELKILPTNHIQFISFGTDVSPCLIDVIRKTYFPEFGKMVERDFQILTEIASYGAESS